MNKKALYILAISLTSAGVAIWAAVIVLFGAALAFTIKVKEKIEPDGEEILVLD